MPEIYNTRGDESSYVIDSTVGRSFGEEQGVQFQPPCCTPAGQLVPRPQRNLGPFCSFATLGGAYCLPAANWRTLLGVPKEPKREFHVGDKSGVNLNRGKIEDAVVRAVTGLT